MMFEDNLRRRVEHIESLVVRGRLTRAQSQSEELLTDFPLFWRATRLLARLHLERGELVEARSLFQRVLAVLPEEAQSHRALATILEQQGQGRQAVGHALCVYEQFPDSPEDRERLRALSHRVWGQPLGALPATPAARGHLMLRQGNPAGAVAQFRRALAQSPTRLDLYSALTTAAWLAGQKKLARRAAQHLHERLPSALVSCLILSRTPRDEAEAPAAQALGARATRLEPTRDLAVRLFGALPAPPRDAARVPQRERRRTPRPTPPPDSSPDWILYLLGRTRAELTRVPQAAPSPAGVDADWLAQRRAELDRTLATREAALPPAEAAWQAGRPDEALTLSRQELERGAATRAAIVARLTRWAESPAAPAALYELLGDLVRQGGDPGAAVDHYREAIERR